MSPPGSKNRTIVRAAAAVVLGLVLVMFLLAHGDPPSAPAVLAQEAAPEDIEARRPPAVPPHPAFVALLDGLAVGQEIDGWRVTRFEPPRDALIYVEVHKGEFWFSVGVALRGVGKRPPPVQTELYDVTYGLVGPQPGAVPEPEILPIVEKVAARIRKQERAAPRPPGL